VEQAVKMKPSVIIASVAYELLSMLRRWEDEALEPWLTSLQEGRQRMIRKMVQYSKDKIMGKKADGT